MEDTVVSYNNLICSSTFIAVITGCREWLIWAQCFISAANVDHNYPATRSDRRPSSSRCSQQSHESNAPTEPGRVKSIFDCRSIQSHEWRALFLSDSTGWCAILVVIATHHCISTHCPSIAYSAYSLYFPCKAIDHYLKFNPREQKLYQKDTRDSSQDKNTRTWRDVYRLICLLTYANP